MATVNIHEAKTHLSRLLARVEAGEEVVIARNGKPVARLVPAQERGRPQPDVFKGQARITDSFFDPLPDEELQAWEGNPNAIGDSLDDLFGTWSQEEAENFNAALEVFGTVDEAEWS